MTRDILGRVVLLWLIAGRSRWAWKNRERKVYRSSDTISTVAVKPYSIRISFQRMFCNVIGRGLTDWFVQDEESVEFPKVSPNSLDRSVTARTFTSAVPLKLDLRGAATERHHLGFCTEYYTFPVYSQYNVITAIYLILTACTVGATSFSIVTCCLVCQLSFLYVQYLPPLLPPAYVCLYLDFYM